MGGLEPPTSASQTRRAGRLRYTPADKSIIRTMTRRQATPIPSFLLPLLALMLALSACLAQPAPAESTPTEHLIPTATATPEATKRVTEEPVVPSPTPDCLLQGGTVSSEQIFSEALETDLDFDLYLPPCYGADSARPLSCGLPAAWSFLPAGSMAAAGLSLNDG